MREQYKSALDKIKLSDLQKEQLRDLYYADSKERKYHAKRRSFGPVAVLAACLALVIAAGTVVPMLQSRWEGASDNTEGNSTDHTRTGNYFAITAYAKELTKTGKVFPDEYMSLSYVMGGDNVGENVDFSFAFPVKCVGKNIDTITYSIDEGLFQIGTQTDGRKSIVVDGEEVEETIEAGANIIGFESSEKLEFGEILDYKLKQYKSFTVDYERQSDKRISIDIVGTSKMWSREKRLQYKKKNIYHRIFSSTGELDKEIYDFLTKDMGITCTVTYKDGSKETKNIVVSNEVVKISDVVKNAEELPVDKDQEMVARYFCIQ